MDIHYQSGMNSTCRADYKFVIFLTLADDSISNGPPAPRLEIEPMLQDHFRDEVRVGGGPAGRPAVPAQETRDE
jgi:hypothetical protein